MGRAELSILFLVFFVGMVVCASSGNSPTWAISKKSGCKSWCVARPSTNVDNLKRATAFYCARPGVDCSLIKPRGPCFEPNTVRDHASVALNLFYKAHSCFPLACPLFVGMTIRTDPSHGKCIYK